MNSKESKAYKTVLACNTNIIDCLKVNRVAKDALNLEYRKREWISVATTLDETELVTLVLNRIANDAGQYDIFMDMLEEIEGMNLIVKRLKESQSNVTEHETSQSTPTDHVTSKREFQIEDLKMKLQSSEAKVAELKKTVQQNDFDLKILRQKEESSRREIEDLKKQLQSSEAKVADFEKTVQQRDLDLEILKQKTSPSAVSPPSAVTCLPTSSNSDNTREYIPPCFSPVATLSQCTHNGTYFHDKYNEFGLEIPAGAIPEGESITIDIGVALYGPFQYPEDLRPVSPVFWVCVRDRKDFQFLKPVEVTIPHCLNLENREDIESLGLTILKGDHEINPQQMYEFQKQEGGSVFEPLNQYGTFKTTHFCSQCISSDIKKEYNIRKAMFSISAVFPSVISTTDSAYFFVTFLLKTCLNVVDEQIRDDPAIKGHKRETRHFQFKKYRTLEMVLPQLPNDWEMGFRFTDKVSASDIRFDNKTSDDLQLMEERGMYPPRFIVPIMCRSLTAGPQLARIRFKGTVKDLVIYIPLVPMPTSPRSPASNITSSSADNPGTNPPGLQTNRIEDEPELVDLMNEVAARIPSKWREVGIQLHLNPNHLDGIAVSVSSPHDRFCSIFTLWKKQMTPPYKWSTVINVLKAPAVNEIRLAEELKNKDTV